MFPKLDLKDQNKDSEKEQKSKQERASKWFCKEVELVKSSCSHLTYLDCILEVCEANNIEFDIVKNLLTKPIKDKMETEALDRKLIKGKKPNTVIL